MFHSGRASEKCCLVVCDLYYKQEIFKNFQAMTCNESLQSPSPSLTGFNIQASVMKIVTLERRESP